MSDVTREEFDELRTQVQENTKRLATGDTTMALLEQKLTQIDDKLSDLAIGVKALQEKPAKKWDDISSTIIKWIVTALLAYIAVKIGLN